VTGACGGKEIRILDYREALPPHLHEKGILHERRVQKALDLRLLAALRHRLGQLLHDDEVLNPKRHLPQNKMSPISKNNSARNIENLQLALESRDDAIHMVLEVARNLKHIADHGH
jgi:hypothetical protein